MFFLKDYFLNLNLFKPAEDSGEREDEHQHQSNIVATRVYLVSLILILIILAVGLWLAPIITTVTIEHPKKEQFELVSFNAQCPCSRISLSYGEFTSLEPSFHQVCSSDFVSDRWIKSIYFGANSTYFYFNDFRTSASAMFQGLAGFCRLAKDNVLQSITSFATSKLISQYVLPKNVFRSQIQSSIQQFQLTAPNTFGIQLQLVRQMIVANRLMSGLQTNTRLIYRSDDWEQLSDFKIFVEAWGYQLDNGSVCDCRMDLNCVVSSGIYDIFGMLSEGLYYDPQLLLSPRGILVGCLPVTGILLSTLECFYNQTCLDELIAFFPTTEKFTAMTTVEQSRFKSNALVRSIVEHLMVERWMTNISYEKYYTQCAPSSCTYSKMERHDIIFILVKLISLLGGLTIVLGLVIPVVIRFIRRPRDPAPVPRLSWNDRLFQMKTFLKKFINELNVFVHHPSNAQQIRYQRYATRIYILIIAISLTVLAFYSSLIVEIHRETVLNPSESQYNELEKKYQNSMSCPCSFISINYSSLITIEPVYHQVCSSDLISSQWIYYNKNISGGYYSNLDYEISAAGHFLLLSTFCQQAQQTVNDSLQVFLQTQFVSSQAISEQMFTPQVDSLFENWQLATVNQFVRTIQVVGAITQGNQLTNGRSNIDWYLDNISRNTTMTLSTYSNCSCGISKSCRYYMALYYSSDAVPSNECYRVSNFFVGCFPVEALLASTLECFYNRSCMIAIDGCKYLRLGTSFNFSALDGNRSSPYDTIESIVSRLMIDTWSPNISFSSYYKACAPVLCTFQYEHRKDWFSVITIVIGVFGGLSLALKIVIVVVLRMLDKVSNGFSCLALMYSIKNLFICHNEQQIISRLHFVLMIVALSILYIFTAFTPQSIIVKVEEPSMFIYKDLMTRFPGSVECPCSQISIQYELFLTITHRLHEVCSGRFVSDDWIIYLYDDGRSTSQFAPTDFRYSASGQFQLLAEFCQLSEQIVNETILQQGKSNFINTHIVSSSSLDERIQTTIDEFKMKMPILFLSILSLIREMNGANMIFSALGTSWVIDTPPFIIGFGYVRTVPLVYQECSCALSWKCVKPSQGMMAGCYPLEALLQSTFRCLYDQQCVDSTKTFEAMNISFSKLNRFTVNATIESVVNQLMVEEYIINMSYEKYFAQCAPSSCSYLYIDKSNIIDGLTNLIALYGGMVILCRLVTVIIVKLFRRRIRRIIPVTD